MVHRVLEAGATRIRFYIDHGYSASKIDVIRPRFEQMLLDAEDPRVVRIWAWRSDRLARRPWDGERILRLADEDRKGHRIRVLTANDGVDTDLPNGDEMLRERIKFARWEAKAIKARTHGRRRELAAEGYWMGRVGYGHEMVDDGRRKVLTVVATEAVVIREVADRLVAREGITAITKDLAARGILTRGMKPWQHTHLHRLMTSPRLAGKVTHDQPAHPGRIEPILEQATYDTVREILLAPGRNPGGEHDGRPRHLLTGLLRCGGCHGLMRAKGAAAYVGKRILRPTYTQYACVRDELHPGACQGVGIRGDHTDAYIEGLVLAALEDEAVKRNASAEPVRDPVADARGRLDEIVRRLTELEVSHLAGTLEEDHGVSEEGYRAYRTRLLGERDAAERLLASEAKTIQIPIVETTPADFWGGATLQQRRVVVRELFAEITILPVKALTNRKRYWDIRRIKVSPRA